MKMSVAKTAKKKSTLQTRISEGAHQSSLSLCYSWLIFSIFDY